MLALFVSLSKLIAFLIGRGQFWVEAPVRVLILGGLGYGGAKLLLPTFEPLIRQNFEFFYGALVLLLVATLAVIGHVGRRLRREG